MSKIANDIAGNAVWDAIKGIGYWVIRQKVAVTVMTAITTAVLAWNDFHSALIAFGAAIVLAFVTASTLVVFEWRKYMRPPVGYAAGFSDMKKTGSSSIPPPMPHVPMPKPPIVGLTPAGNAFASLFDLASRPTTPEMRINGLEGEIERLKKDVDEWKKKYSEVYGEKLSKNYELATARIYWIGCESPVSRNLSLIVRFIHPDDSSVAEEIEGWFLRGSSNPPWHIRINQIQWERNPTSNRILLTSKDVGLAKTLTNIFNGHGLISEPIAEWFHDSLENENVVITIYSEPKPQSRP